MLTAEIVALPASWYAAQPIPARLALAVGYHQKSETTYASAVPPRAVATMSGVFTSPSPLSHVERAHANAERVLITADGWVCPKCGRVWSPSTDRCKACRP